MTIPQASRLENLNARVRQDLEYLNYPPANWSKPIAGETGETVSDVVIIGGGMCGLVAWLSLTRAGIRNLRIVDRSPKGLEGPRSPMPAWKRSARRRTCSVRRWAWRR